MQLDPSNRSGAASYDARLHCKGGQVVYKNLHSFRCDQASQGLEVNQLSDIQWGLVPLDRCHHISITASSKDGPQSFRVRICKTCCQETCHIELGTYADQESAILVNDAFEIMNNRTDKLLVLAADDHPHLHMLLARKVDRKGKDYTSVLDLISERVSAPENKKRRSPGSSDSATSHSASGDSHDSSKKARTSPVSTELSDSEEEDEEDGGGETEEEETSATSATSARGSATASCGSTGSATKIPVPQHIPFHLPPPTAPMASSSSNTPSYARQRSFTFSTAADYSPSKYGAFYAQLHANKTPIDTLTWLASLEDDEVDVAKSLFALKGAGHGQQAQDDSLCSPQSARARKESEDGAEQLLFLSNAQDQEDEQEDEDDDEEMDEEYARLQERSKALQKGRRGRAMSMSILERPLLPNLMPTSLALVGNSPGRGERLFHCLSVSVCCAADRCVLCLQIRCPSC